MRVWPTFLMVVVLVLLLLPASAARASPYWIAYEGNDFPENEGWPRRTSWGGAQRSLEDGWLVLDGRADPRIYDYYELAVPGGIDPGPGELFVAQWRVYVDHVLGQYDAGLSVVSDAHWTVAFALSQDTVYSMCETGVSATFEPGRPHTFELRSADMRSYVLSIDGNPAIHGRFWEGLTTSAVAWGDSVYHAASLSRWDYVRFGVVPEPGSIVLGMLSALLLSTSTRR